MAPQPNQDPTPTDLAPVQATCRELGHLSKIAEQASEFVSHSKAANTVLAYKRDWQDFTQWCERHGQLSLPASPDTTALYVSDLAATRKTSTIIRRCSAISQAHQIRGFETPTKSARVRLVLAGIRRTKGVASHEKAPVLADDLNRMIARLPDGKIGVRDRSLLLIGFAGGFRRSELVGLDRSDVNITRDGIVVNLRWSKTDQEGVGRKIGIPYGSHPRSCPVRALEDWLEASGITAGPLFRPVNRHGKIGPNRMLPKAVAAIVKRSAERIGLDATKFAGQSLRSGLCTTAAMSGASERSIQAQTGHKSVNMVRRYIRDGSLFRENAAAVVGL